MTVHYRSAVVTDLDGTLLDDSRQISAGDHAALLALEAAGCARIVATGRSLYSADRVLAADTPIDFLIFASGAGVMHWPSRRLIASWSLTGREALTAAETICAAGLNVMIHEPVPDNHHFTYLYQHEDGTDFQRRCEIYAPYCRRIECLPEQLGAASQLITIIPPDIGCFETIRERLPGYTVIRTTSPLGADSIWIEIFPPHVSKSQGSSWLMQHLGIPHGCTYALGNDYNDLDLLEWATSAAVVENAPEDLRQRFPVVPSHRLCGFRAAVRGWGLC